MSDVKSPVGKYFSPGKISLKKYPQKKIFFLGKISWSGNLSHFLPLQIVWPYMLPFKFFFFKHKSQTFFLWNSVKCHYLTTLHYLIKFPFSTPLYTLVHQSGRAYSSIQPRVRLRHQHSFVSRAFICYDLQHANQVYLWKKCTFLLVFNC